MPAVRGATVAGFLADPRSEPIPHAHGRARLPRLRRRAAGDGRAGEPLFRRWRDPGEPLVEGPGLLEPSPRLPWSSPTSSSCRSRPSTGAATASATARAIYDGRSPRCARAARSQSASPSPCRRSTRVPDEDHDQPLDFVLTENELIDSRPATDARTSRLHAASVHRRCRGPRRPRRGRSTICPAAPRWSLDFVVVNGENAAGGFGITETICDDFLDAGADCVTLGNHAWDQREALVFIERQPRLIRPAQLPARHARAWRGLIEGQTARACSS